MLQAEAAARARLAARGCHELRERIQEKGGLRGQWRNPAVLGSCIERAPLGASGDTRSGLRREARAGNVARE